MTHTPKKDVKHPTFTKWFARLISTVYFILFPFLLWVSLFSFMITDSQRTPSFLIHITIISIIAIPISMLVGAIKMRSSFKKKEYKETYIYSLLPFFMSLIAFILTVIVDMFIFGKLWTWVNNNNYLRKFNLI